MINNTLFCLRFNFNIDYNLKTTLWQMFVPANLLIGQLPRNKILKFEYFEKTSRLHRKVTNKKIKLPQKLSITANN